MSAWGVEDQHAFMNGSGLFEQRLGRLVGFRGTIARRTRASACQHDEEPQCPECCSVSSLPP